jgi:hypothetical protein
VFTVGTVVFTVGIVVLFTVGIVVFTVGIVVVSTVGIVVALLYLLFSDLGFLIPL